MVCYAPPDAVLMAIGAAQTSAWLLESGYQALKEAKTLKGEIERYGWDEDAEASLERTLRELMRMSRDPKLQKNEHPVQMGEIPSLMDQIRVWLRRLRSLALINLAEDALALARLASPAPELPTGYPRALLDELTVRLRAASDLKPRLEEVGLNERFLGQGRRLHTQLSTAIGKKDLSPADLPLQLRMYYSRKGQAFIAIRRLEQGLKLASQTSA